jgi:tetrahydromethanopterin S-methyltransferase subunit G
MNLTWVIIALLMIAIIVIGSELEKANKHLKEIQNLLEPVSREAKQRLSKQWEEDHRI